MIGPKDCEAGRVKLLPNMFVRLTGVSEWVLLQLRCFRNLGTLIFRKACGTKPRVSGGSRYLPNLIRIRVCTVCMIWCVPLPTANIIF